MKKILILALISMQLYATEYMGKQEPYKSYTISSEVSGVITYTNDKKEFSHIKDKELIVKIDSTDEDIELKSQKESLKNLDEIYNIQKQNYKSKSRVKQISRYNKNQEKLAYLQTKQTILQTQKSIKTLENTKRKKSLSVENRYLSKIYKDVGEVVNVGELLYECYDFSKSKIVLYIKPEDLKNIENKSIYIDNQKSDYKINKISKVRDKSRVSTYEVDIIKDNNLDNTRFGKIVKVEFR
jgi:hypothetical protein